MEQLPAVKNTTTVAEWVGGNRVNVPPSSDSTITRAQLAARSAKSPLGLDADALVTLRRRRSRLGLSVWAK